MTTSDLLQIEDRPQSKRCYQRACLVTPGGVHSPVRAFKGMGLSPLIVDRGEGDEIVDVDGYRYIDYCCSWGALLHGHAHPSIVSAVTERMAKGSSFGISMPIEAELASALLKHLPADQLRFVSSGTEATMTALRLARGMTGKDVVIKFTGHYHGHGDSFLVQAGSGCLHLDSTASSAGVPQQIAALTLCLPFNDKELLLQALQRQDIAAVIVEPIAANMGVVPPQPGFLELLRQETAKRGIVLIFDEVITGFRLHRGGACCIYGLEPDLICLGKIIGGGFPVAALAGRERIMSYLAPLGPVYQAGTLSGNPVAMAAGLEAMRLIEEPDFYQRLEAKTKLLTEPVRDLIEEHDLPACIHQIGSMFTLFLGQREVRSLEDVKKCDAELFRELFKFMLERGVYFSPSQYEANFISSAHTQEHLLYTQESLLEFLLTKMMH